MLLMVQHTDPDVGEQVLPALDEVDSALSAVPTTPDTYRGLSDADLIAANTRLGHSRDVLSTVGVLLAGEVARRSAPEFGSNGLAQRNGFRTPVELVKVTTRASGREAVSTVRAGTLLLDTAGDGTVNQVTGVLVAPAEPWLVPVAVALTDGVLSLAAADAIRYGIGRPSTAVTVEELTFAVAQLCVEARTLDPDRVMKRARTLRNEIDQAGVGIREEEQRSSRELKLVALPNGMGRLVWTMDPETFATITDLYDRATSPKRGGIRFTSNPDTTNRDGSENPDGSIQAGRNGDRQGKRDQILADPRTPGQLASDSFTHLLVAGADADSSTLIGTGAPILKLTTTTRTLETARTAKEHLVAAVAGTSTRTGEGAAAGRAADLRVRAEAHGHLEGRTDAVSIGTIERALCCGTSEESSSTNTATSTKPPPAAGRPLA
jgi:hypothetical protein